MRGAVRGVKKASSRILLGKGDRASPGFVLWSNALSPSWRGTKGEDVQGKNKSFCLVPLDTLRLERSTRGTDYSCFTSLRSCLCGSPSDSGERNCIEVMRERKSIIQQKSTSNQFHTLLPSEQLAQISMFFRPLSTLVRNSW